VTLGVPVFYPCRACHGGRYAGAFGCRACDARGMVEEEEDVTLVISPLVRDGTVLRVPLRGLGIHSLFLQVLVRVGV
jgi:molecular chaperone DnaJ